MPHTIGFVDYQLDNFHANVFLNLIRGELSDLGFEVSGCCALDTAAGPLWAEANEVPWYADAAALGEKVECFMVLAPSNPEVHLQLAQAVLPFGKPTYIDKTFAPDLATAREIFALADRHQAPVQTSSALRYTDAQAHARELGREHIRHVVTWGGGRSFGEYAIHPLELAVSILGPGAGRVHRRGAGDEGQLLIDYPEARTAVVNVFPGTDTGFAAAITSDAATRHIRVDDSRLFRDAASGILDFLRSGAPTVDRAESLEIRAILDAAELPDARHGFVPITV